jgi:hypothetical protein
MIMIQNTTAQLPQVQDPEELVLVVCSKQCYVATAMAAQGTATGNSASNAHVPLTPSALNNK